ncbi:MAG TPA: peptidoglycan DD-metalloendopeptidase family protein [Gaiellaceae bacterium]|nr:peptidoglycan DD-metalloendopeptidase family protein [Gaiellaceae bacterium]
MVRRAALAFLALVLIAAPAGAGSIAGQKQSLDAHIALLGDRVARSRAQEARVRAEIASASAQIRALELRVGDVSTRLGPLERELALRERNVARLDALYGLQTERLRWLRQESRLTVRRLNRRLVTLYETDEPDTLEVLFSARSFSDALSGLDYLEQVGRADKRIAEAVAEARTEVAAARTRTARARTQMRQERRVLAVRVAQARALRAELVAGRSSLVATRAARQQALAHLTAQERQELAEMEALQAESERLGAAIRAAQERAAEQARAVSRASAQPAATAATASAPPSSSGLVWPVSGPITSPFGWRWGRMHEGIDIGAGDGTPIHAAAAGRVVYAGWMEGYGNLVAIDHGNGLSTAYAHQERIVVSLGEEVSQGQVIGYVGCTGRCFGPHLHFEVRVNGAPVDPLGYL